MSSYWESQQAHYVQNQPPAFPYQHPMQPAQRPCYNCAQYGTTAAPTTPTPYTQVAPFPEPGKEQISDKLKRKIEDGVKKYCKKAEELLQPSAPVGTTQPPPTGPHASPPSVQQPQQNYCTQPAPAWANQSPPTVPYAGVHTYVQQPSYYSQPAPPPGPVYANPTYYHPNYIQAPAAPAPPQVPFYTPSQATQKPQAGHTGFWGQLEELNTELQKLAAKMESDNNNNNYNHNHNHHNYDNGNYDNNDYCDSNNY